MSKAIDIGTQKSYNILLNELLFLTDLENFWKKYFLILETT